MAFPVRIRYARARGKERGAEANSKATKRDARCDARRALAMPAWPPLDMSAGDVSIYHRGTTFLQHPRTVLPPRLPPLFSTLRLPANLPRVPIGILLIRSNAPSCLPNYARDACARPNYKISLPPPPRISSIHSPMRYSINPRRRVIALPRYSMQAIERLRAPRGNIAGTTKTVPSSTMCPYTERG